MSAVFNAYSAYYDLFNADKDYAAEAAYVVGLIRRRAPVASKLLECGCGTGAHAVHLVANGFAVTGIDLSMQMLERAERRRLALRKDLAERLCFRCGDARSIELSDRFDAVVALFHVMSYQITDSDVDALFRCAARHLNPRGVFIFDFWHGPAVLTRRPEVRIKRCSAGNMSAERLAEPEFIVSENRVAVSYTFRVDVDQNSRPLQFSERHDMRYFFLPELRRFAAEYFDVVETYAWMTDRAPGVDDWSAVEVLQLR